MNDDLLLEPWEKKPIELLSHAEIHYKIGLKDSSDYDKRMAYISFDNSIEISITIFIHRNTKPKGLKLYNDEDLKNMKNSFFKKLKKIMELIDTEQGLPFKNDILKPKFFDKIIYLHEQRNELYHGYDIRPPNNDDLNDILKISHRIFSALFKKEPQPLIAKFIKEQLPNHEMRKISQNYDISDIQIQNSKIESLLYAAILGGWNENYNDDRIIIQKITKTDFEQWINDIREINSTNEEIFSLQNGNWEVKDKNSILLKYISYFYEIHLETIQSRAIEILSEIDPKFDLPKENRWVANIHKKVPKYSNKLKKGICETLVFLNMNKKSLKNLNSSEVERIIYITINDLFKDSDWKLWGGLDKLLLILAEASPEAFLESVENALKQNPCPFDKLFKQGNGGLMMSNYIIELCWALEILAWSKDYLSRSVLLLAELATHGTYKSNHSNEPIDSIVTILLPWLPQTMGSIEIRIAAIKGIQKNFPQIAWEILLRLLPKAHQSSMGTAKPEYRNFIPEGWKQTVITEDYKKQIKECSLMVVEMAKTKIDYITKLVEYLDNLFPLAFDTFLDHLSSQTITKLNDEKKYPIWNNLNSLAKKHRNYSYTKWALPSDMVDKIETTAKNIKPINIEILYRRFFSGNNQDFWEKGINWKEQEEKLLSQQKRL